ncbi:MAG: Txe/YoeB family addiction module toxin [Phascolarctobacterium sp.]|nr:Txe/YoeB family addiction module toxin [Candidatus Phascolarctobacterium caballi]
MLLQSEDKQMVKKIHTLIKEIMRTPFEGTGKPERLRGFDGEYWSRRINQKDRLVYKFSDNIVYVVSCKNHYDDK